MLTLGLQVKTHRGKRIVCAVVLDDDDAVVLPLKHIPDQKHSKATQARELHDTLTTALKGMTIRAAVLLEADFHQRRGLTDGVVDRLRLEGICLAAARVAVGVVEVLDGPALGRAFGTSKDEALAAGASLDVDGILGDAAAAAVAARTV